MCVVLIVLNLSGERPSHSMDAIRRYIKHAPRGRTIALSPEDVTISKVLVRSQPGVASLGIHLNTQDDIRGITVIIQDANFNKYNISGGHLRNRKAMIARIISELSAKAHCERISKLHSYGQMAVAHLT